MGLSQGHMVHKIGMLILLSALYNASNILSSKLLFKKNQTQKKILSSMQEHPFHSDVFHLSHERRLKVTVHPNTLKELKLCLLEWLFVFQGPIVVCYFKIKQCEVSVLLRVTYMPPWMFQVKIIFELPKCRRILEKLLVSQTFS